MHWSVNVNYSEMIPGYMCIYPSYCTILIFSSLKGFMIFILFYFFVF